MDEIVIKGARENNLKNIDLTNLKNEDKWILSKYEK